MLQLGGEEGRSQNQMSHDGTKQGHVTCYVKDLFLERSSMMSNMVTPEIPFIFHFFVTDLTLHLTAHCVHVQDMLKYI